MEGEQQISNKKEESIEKMVEINEEFKEAEENKNKGNEFYKLGDYRQALDFYTKAIELAPKNASYYANRAAAYMMLKKYKESIEDAKLAVKQDENFVKAYIREGKCHLYLGDFKAALRCFEKVKQIEPNNDSINKDVQNVNSVKFFVEDGEKAYKSGDYRKVVYTMDRALEYSPECLQFKLFKAETLALLGRYQESQEIANDCLTKDNTNVDAIYVRGICLYYQDNPEKAFQHFQRVLQYSPDHEKAKVFYKKAKQLQNKKEAGNAAFKAGNYQEAYDLYTECLSYDLNNKSLNAILYSNRATASSKLNKLDKCIEDCTKAIELDDSYLKAYLKRAKAYMDTEQYEQAVQDYERVCKLDKTKENAHLLKNAKIELKKSKRKDYYKILGISKTASDDDIKKAYRKAALLHHPDRFPNETEEVKREEERKFKEVGEAYQVLSDAKKKQRYDNGQDLDDSGCGFGDGMGAEIDPNLIFQAFFGGGGGGGGGDGFPFTFSTSSSSSRSSGRGGGGGPGGFAFNFGR